MPAHYTPIPTGTAVSNDAPLFNARFQELDDAIVAIETATNFTGFTKLKLKAPTTLTLDAAGAITPTQTWHLVDTFGGAADDGLVTISGGVDGQLLILQIANVARRVTVEHNTGNVYNQNATNRLMNATQQAVFLQYSNTLSRWVELNPHGINLRETLSAAITPITQIQLPDRVLVGSTAYQRRLAVMPSYEVSNRWEVRAAAAILQPIGIAALTNAATTVLSLSNQTDSTYVNVASGAASGNCGGFGSTTFDLVRRQYDPVFEWIWTSGAAADIANIRLWMGIFQQAPTNVDTLAASTAAMAFRLTTGTDSFFMGVTNDGSAQATPVSTGVALAADTRYKFRIRVDSTNGIVYFSVNDSAEVSLNTNLPSASQNLGFNLYVFTTAAVAKNWKFSRAVCLFK